MTDPLQIAAEITPNPNTLKFVLNRPLLSFGSRNYLKKEDVTDSPLAAALFDVGDVVSIMVGTDFVTVTKTPQSDWQNIGPFVVTRLREFFDSGQEAIAANASVSVHAEGRSEIEKKIIEILDNEIRPAVARDGGDIVFYGYDNGVVKLQLQGACSSCPSSIMTLKMGIENRLKMVIPEVKEVLQV